ncbi:MAG: DUF3617 domain-containing protein [Nevskiaceae bacterium]
MRKLVVLAMGLLPVVAHAADKGPKPGLYDYTVKMEMPGMPFAMPPQNFQSCVKQEDVDKGKQFQTQRDEDCEVKNMKQSAGKASFDMACKDGTTGHAEYTFTDTSMTGKQVLNREGTAMTMNMSAKRTGDCK